MSIETQTRISTSPVAQTGSLIGQPHRFNRTSHDVDSSPAPTSISMAMDHIFRRPTTMQSDRKVVVELTHAISRAVFEIVAGYRSVSQLAFVMDPECVKKLRSQALMQSGGYTIQPAPGTSHGQVQSLHLRRTLSGAYECSVVMVFKYRVRAVALRIEPWHGRWQVTSVEML